MGSLRYRAGTPDTGPTASFCFGVDERDFLCIQAIPVGDVSVISPQAFPFATYSKLSAGGTGAQRQDVLRRFSAQLRDFHDSAAALAYGSPGIYLPTGQSRTEAFWRTLIGDRIIIGLHEQASPGLLVSDGFPAPQEFHEIYEGWHRYMEELGLAIQNEKSKEGLYSKKAEVFSIALDTARLEGNFAMTDNGLMTMIPLFAQPGDHICVVPGLAKSIVLRANSEGSDSPKRDIWQLVGECFVHGFMQGEALTSQRHELRRYVIK